MNMSVVEKLKLNSVSVNHGLLVLVQDHPYTELHTALINEVQTLIDSKFKLAASFSSLTIDQISEIIEYADISKKYSYLCIKYLNDCCMDRDTDKYYERFDEEYGVSTIIATWLLENHKDECIPFRNLRNIKTMLRHHSIERLEFIFFKDREERNNYCKGLDEKRARTNSKEQEAASKEIDLPPSYADVVPSAPPM